MHKLYTFLFLVFSFSLMAQPRLAQSEMYVGLNLGVTESMVGFNPSVKQGFLMGYNGGFVYRYVGNKYVGVQAELNFSQRGWTEKSGLYTRQLNYVELPFLTHFYVGNKNRVFLNIGPKISYLLSEKVLKDGTTGTDTQHVTLIQNPFDYGLCGGLGFLFNIKGNIFQLDSRVNFGLSDIFSNDKRDYFATSNNMDASVNLAWMLKVK
ncbi:MAG: porin family protein [Paludibacter sp.]